MPIGPSGDSAGPPEETQPPPDGPRNSRLARYVRTPVVWAAAALVLIAGTGALLVTQEAGGQPAQPRAQAALCGLVSCADVRSAAASTRSARRAAPTRPPSPAPAATPTPTGTPAPAVSPQPAPDPEPAPAPVSGPAPAPPRGHRPHRVPSWSPPPRWPWPPYWPWQQWPPPWRDGYPGGGRYFPWSPWGK
jgi:hypothetical protein